VKNIGCAASAQQAEQQEENRQFCHSSGSTAQSMPHEARTNSLTTMATLHHTALSYRELFGEPNHDHFGQNAKKQAACINAVYRNWRMNADAPDPYEVQDELLLDFTRWIGGVIMFVEEQLPHMHS
jgi:hypothetical protein